MIIDLRSDFLSRPTPAMTEAMVRAAAEPAYFGLREDPYQRSLEEKTAILLGQEDALFFPTCTMANEVALMLHARPGEVVLTQGQAHIITSEAGGPAALGGLFVEAVADSAKPDLSVWLSAMRRSFDELKPRIAALNLENTHNRAGGLPLDVEYTQALAAMAHENGIRSHLDGSRLFNAAAALHCKPADLARSFDTVAISLNKGLGAPIGAMLAGSTAQIKQALLLRQRLGGGIRPTGPLAAAGIVALSQWTDVGADHIRAMALAKGIASSGRAAVNRPETNIVLMQCPPAFSNSTEFSAALEARGLLALPFGEKQIRLVTYRDIDDASIQQAVEIIQSIT